LVGDFAPTVFADRDDFSFELDVQFDLFAVAGVFPRVFTMLNVVFHDLFLKNAYGVFFAFKEAV
jgi:hypothetical protein